MAKRRGGRGSGPEATRERIAAAAAALHEEVGVAATTIKAIAERAGVQRLTVYRHFPDEASLYGACSAHWSERHPAPDASEWAGLGDPEARLRAALLALYGHYREGATMLTHVLRDEEELPALAAVMRPYHAWQREVAGGLAAGWGASGDAQARVRAAVGHAVGFWTWRSLAAQGLDVPAAAELMVRLVRAAAA